MKKIFHTLKSKSFKTPLDRSEHVPPLRGWFGVINSLTVKQRRILAGLLVIFIVSTISFFKIVDGKYFSDAPAHGGEFSEGIIGSPRFINPLLATSDVDRDLIMLVYEGLLEVSDDGSYEPALAESYSISDDGLTYEVILKENLVWHDGRPITASDVFFTIDRIQDGQLKSPEQANWQGVGVNVNDGERKITFSLSNNYSPFLENLTLGIVPEHIWKDAPPEQTIFSPNNLSPVGSGPYRVDRVNKNGDGVIESIDLVSFDDYYKGEANVARIHLAFFDSEDKMLPAYLAGKIDSMGGISPQTALWLSKEKEAIVTEGPLPRVFGVFFNQNQAPIFLNLEVRKALEEAIDKEALVNSILLGYGVAIDGPLAPPYNKTRVSSEVTGKTKIESAREILEKSGWILGSDGIYEKKSGSSTTKLAFSISTINSGDLKVAAEEVVKVWTELGASVELKLFERGDLNQDVIRPRKYDALLFGQITGKYPDPFAFWHSSQRLDPGLNIALYTNAKSDKILEDIRDTRDLSKRAELYSDFSEIILNERPAIFLYSPNYIYIAPKNIAGVFLSTKYGSSGRFAHISDWYRYKNRTWFK